MNISENIPLTRDTIVEYMTDAIIVLNQDRIVIDINLAALTLLNRDESEFIGRTYDEIFSSYPLIREIIRDFDDQIDVSEFVIETTLNETQHIEFRISSLNNPEQAFWGWLLILRDITSQKEAELESTRHLNEVMMLRSVDEHMTETLDINEVLCIGLDGAITMTNADAGIISIIVDKNMQQVVHVGGKYPVDFLGKMYPLDNGICGRVAHTLKAEMVNNVSTDPDYLAKIETTEAQITVPLMARERLTGLLILEVDDTAQFDINEFEFARSLGRRIAIALENALLFTQSRQQLSELKALNARLRDMEAQKTDLIRIAAHDLSNPVSTILGFLDLFVIDRDYLVDEHKIFVDTMLEQARRMDTIINEILSVERVKEGTVWELINLTALAQEAFTQYERDATEKALNYQLHSIDEELIVFGDGAQTREAMRNLITNAIKYTEKGSVTITVRQKGGMATFTVQDTGYGIPDEEQHQVFQPFSRAKIPGAELIRGTGLGLHLVKSIVERHQGQMIFHSTYGKGSLFGFELPLHIE